MPSLRKKQCKNDEIDQPTSEHAFDSQAEIFFYILAALQAIVFRGTLSLFILLQSSKACGHSMPFSRTLMAAL